MPAFSDYQPMDKPRIPHREQPLTTRTPEFSTPSSYRFEEARSYTPIKSTPYIPSAQPY